MRRLAIAAAILILGLLLTEGVLRLAALAAPGLLSRRSAPESGEVFRILCLGDSHTYGLGVERDESYPAQLASLLNPPGAPSRFAVTNLGIPGANSAQLLEALPHNLSYYHPNLLLVMIGGNDGVNRAGLGGAAEEGRLARLHRRLWQYSRLYRLLALTRHDRTLRSMPRPDVEVTWSNMFDAVDVRHGEFTEKFRHQIAWGLFLTSEQQERIARRNLLEIERLAEEAGVPLVFLSYVIETEPHGTANRVMRGIGGSHFVSQIFPRDLESYLPRLSAEERTRGFFLEDLHARPPIYVALAAHLREALDQEGLLPAAP